MDPCLEPSCTGLANHRHQSIAPATFLNHDKMGSSPPLRPPSHARPTAWMTYFAASRYLRVILAEPVGQPPSVRNSASSSGNFDYGRPYAHRLQLSGLVHGADQARRAPRLGCGKQDAIVHPARRTNHGRSRFSRDRVRRPDRVFGSGRNAKTNRRPAQPRNWQYRRA